MADDDHRTTAGQKEDRIRIGNWSPGDVALLRDIAEQAADNAVKKTFIAMGLDANDPLTAQDEFSYMRTVIEKVKDPSFRADLHWLRRTRERCEGILGKAIAVAVGIAVLGGANVFWTGFKSAIASLPVPPPGH